MEHQTFGVISLCFSLAILCGGCGTGKREAITFGKNLTRYSAQVDNANIRQTLVLAQLLQWTNRDITRGAMIGDSPGADVLKQFDAIRSILDGIEVTVQGNNVKEQYLQVQKLNLVSAIQERSRRLSMTTELMNQVNKNWHVFKATDCQDLFNNPAYCQPGWFPDGLEKLNAQLKTFAAPDNPIPAIITGIRIKYNLTDEDLR